MRALSMIIGTVLWGVSIGVWVWSERQRTLRFQMHLEQDRLRVEEQKLERDAAIRQATAMARAFRTEIQRPPESEAESGGMDS